jgi:hypothetical protein
VSRCKHPPETCQQTIGSWTLPLGATRGGVATVAGVQETVTQRCTLCQAERRQVQNPKWNQPTPCLVVNRYIWGPWRSAGARVREALMAPKEITITQFVSTPGVAKYCTVKVKHPK